METVLSRKSIGIGVVGLMLALAGFLLFSALGSSQVSAGNGLPQGAHRVFSFNLNGYPAHKEYTGGCGNGHRIFINRDVKNAHIDVTHTGTWAVTDCNATKGNRASLTAGDIGTFDMYLRLVGKPETGAGDTLRICADLTVDGEDHLCLIGEVKLKREAGKSSFRLFTSDLFDDGGEDVTWHTDTSKDFRIAQFVVVEK